jgi:L-fuconolactonase
MNGVQGKPGHIPVRPDWLALRTEPALEPDLPIVDPHHHLWDRPHGRYLVSDLASDLASGHDVRATIFVECHEAYSDTGPEELRPVGETEFAVAQARVGGVAAGIIAYAELRLGDGIDAVLDAHEAAADGRLRGVRNSSVWHPDPAARGSLLTPPPGLLLEPSFRAGLRRLARRGLAFDAWMYHTQLSELADLAAACPEASIVLVHLGGPIGIGPYAGRRDEVFAAWRASMRGISSFPNLAVKLGGMGMRLFGFDFHESHRPPGSEALNEAWRPYIEECLTLFGPERCMFESNFPVDKGTCSYGVLWNAFKRATARLSRQEREALFANTARRVYQLPV